MSLQGEQVFQCHPLSKTILCASLACVPPQLSKQCGKGIGVRLLTKFKAGSAMMGLSDVDLATSTLLLTSHDTPKSPTYALDPMPWALRPEAQHQESQSGYD